MSHCDSIRENLTAWIDGELPPSERQHLGAHLDSCQACSTEADALRQAITWQEQTLPKGLLEAPVDVDALRIGLRRQLVAIHEREESTPVRSWSWLLRPLVMATAAVAVALFVLVWKVGEPEPLLVSLGVEPAPEEVVKKPEMFRYLDVIQNLEALEHFDAVEAVSLEDERAHADTVRHG